MVGGGLCFQDTQANWSTQFDSCFFLCKATKLNYMEAFLISAANIRFPSFHFWSTNERCAFLLLIRNDTIHFFNHWVSKQRRQMASLTPDRKPCALLESAYFLLAYSYILCMGGRCQRVICARTKNKVCFIAWVFPLDARTITYLSCLLSFHRTNYSYVCCCVCFAKLECQLIFLGIEIYPSNLS